MTVYMFWQPPVTPVESHWNRGERDGPQRKKRKGTRGRGDIPCIFDTISEAEKGARSTLPSHRGQRVTYLGSGYPWDWKILRKCKVIKRISEARQKKAVQSSVRYPLAL